MLIHSSMTLLILFVSIDASTTNLFSPLNYCVLYAKVNNDHGDDDDNSISIAKEIYLKCFPFFDFT